MPPRKSNKNIENNSMSIKSDEKQTHIKVTGIPTKEDLKEASREDLVELCIGTLTAMTEMNSEMTKMKSSYELSMKRAEQDLEINAHEIERKKLFTLFDVITNTKELLIQRMNDSGKVDMQHVVDKGTTFAANNVIKLALKQSYLWLEKNDINKPKLKQDEKQTEKQGTNPDDITTRDLFPTPSE
jgi:hypothetical protein